MSIPRTLFDAEHRLFRDSIQRFLAREAVPHNEAWEAQGFVDRELWHKAGANGLLCPSMPTELGGMGVDQRFSVVLIEELARANLSGPGWSLHSEIVAPYLLHYGSRALQERYLPSMARGERVGAIAMTEPDTGSDLQAVRTSARREGDHYVLNGAKTFITNGWHSDLVIVVAKTDPDRGAKGISLLVVDTASEGFSKGKPLKKIGLKAQDTAELFFDNVLVPAENLLGEESKGFTYLMQELPWERLQIAITAIASAEAALEWTVAWCRDRHAFGAPLLSLQNTRFTLAELKTDVQVGRVFVDRCIEQMLEGTLDATTASMAKLWSTEIQFKVMDACMQLHGGHGYMWENPIARAWADSRVQRIYGGTNEIMKELIGRSL